MDPSKRLTFLACPFSEALPIMREAGPSVRLLMHTSRSGDVTRRPPTRSRRPDDAAFLDPPCDLRVPSLEEYVDRIVATAPPLSNEQRDRIAVLLRCGSCAR